MNVLGHGCASRGHAADPARGNTADSVQSTRASTRAESTAAGSSDGRLVTRRPSHRLERSERAVRTQLTLINSIDRTGTARGCLDGEARRRGRWPVRRTRLSSSPAWPLADLARRCALDKSTCASLLASGGEGSGRERVHGYQKRAVRSPPTLTSSSLRRPKPGCITQLDTH